MVQVFFKQSHHAKAKTNEPVISGGEKISRKEMTIFHTLPNVYFLYRFTKLKHKLNDH